MSLNAAAQHLAAHGRGPDNTLVHMSRGEVKGLQDLAMAHGGSLSINPQTGLPEAGFLSSLLPMIGGAALTAFSGGAINPMMASMIMGGVTGVASGSLSKGLMAGLGAYGGAGMMGGLMGAGQGAMAAQGIQAAGMPQFTGDTAAYAQQVDALRSAELAKATQAPLMEQAKAGFSKIGEAPGQFFKDNWKYAAAAAPSVIQAITPTTKQPEIKSNSDPGQQYKYSPGRVDQTPDPDPSGREQSYFNPIYTPITQPDAKSIYGFAGGGTVEQMSNANAIGTNTGYPMADITKGAYATPYQQPISRNVLTGVTDTGINPMTGEMSFADGGVATATSMPDQYSYDPLTQMFKKIESMPSDNQPKNAQPPKGGYSPVMSDAAFAKQQSEGQKNMQAMQDGTMMSRIGESLSEGLSFMAQNSPTMALINAITSAISGQGSSSGAGFGAPGATSGNAGAMGFGPSGMAGGFGGGSTGATGATGGGGGGGGKGGAPGAPGLGANSGGGFGVTGPGGTAGVGGTAGAASGAAQGGLMAAFANGGSHLGDYSDGGRLLKGPGDGVSDSIPAMIGKKQPARLADGEFVVPARIVSELGNGSTEAGARKLYAMMDRVQKARGSTVGKGRVAKNSRAERFLPA